MIVGAAMAGWKRPLPQPKPAIGSRCMKKARISAASSGWPEPRRTSGKYSNMFDITGHDSQASASALSEHIRRFGTDRKQKTGVHPDCGRRRSPDSADPRRNRSGGVQRLESALRKPPTWERVAIIGGAPSVWKPRCLWRPKERSLRKSFIFSSPMRPKALIGSES